MTYMTFGFPTDDLRLVAAGEEGRRSRHERAKLRIRIANQAVCKEC